MRKLRLSLCCLLCLSHSCRAQAPGSTSTPEAIPRGRLTGRVICTDTRRPARGALVSLIPLRDVDGSPLHSGLVGQRFAHVRDDGTYTFAHLAPGTYTAFATMAGYVSSLDDLLDIDPKLGESSKMEHALEKQPASTLLPNGTAVLNLAMERGAALSGQVIYSDGAPATSIQLLPEDATAKPPSRDDTNLRLAMDLSFARRIYAIGTVSTDDRGHFRVAGLRPGKYRLAAIEPVPGGTETDPMELSQQVSLTLFNIPDPRGLRVYAGDTVHAASAKTFTVRPGDEVTGILITLPLDSLHEVRGQVLATDGRAVNMGDLTLSSTSDAQLRFGTKLAVDGSFVFDDVPPGNYKLSINGARIGERASGPPGVPTDYLPLQPVAAFADGSLPVLVQDDDLDALRLALSPTSLPDSSTVPGADKP